MDHNFQEVRRLLIEEGLCRSEIAERLKGVVTKGILVTWCKQILHEIGTQERLGVIARRKRRA